MYALKIKVLVPPTDSNPFAIIYKPSSLPSAPLKPEDDCAINQAMEIFPALKNVTSKKKQIEYGLLHRIDTETSGLLLIAATQECYDFLYEQQTKGLFTKFYRAKVEPLAQKDLNLSQSFPPVDFIQTNSIQSCRNFQITSKFRYFGINNSEVRPVTEKSGKAALNKAVNKIYTTNVELYPDNKVVCNITQGFKHQVRCHLRWIGFPIAGDKVYNPQAGENKFEFEAFKIKFVHPVTGLDFTFEI